MASRDAKTLIREAHEFLKKVNLVVTEAPGTAVAEERLIYSLAANRPGYRCPRCASRWIFTKARNCPRCVRVTLREDREGRDDFFRDAVHRPPRRSTPRRSPRAHRLPRRRHPQDRRNPIPHPNRPAQRPRVHPHDGTGRRHRLPLGRLHAQRATLARQLRPAARTGRASRPALHRGHLLRRPRTLRHPRPILLQAPRAHHRGQDRRTHGSCSTTKHSCDRTSTPSSSVPAKKTFPTTSPPGFASAKMQAASPTSSRPR